MPKNNKVFEFEGEFHLLTEKCPRKNGEKLEANVQVFRRRVRESIKLENCKEQ
jgi:hypothetical protein